MNNLQRAAVVLLGMGKDQAARVLKHMEPAHVEKLAFAMQSIVDVDEHQIDDALGKFIEVSENSTNIGVMTNDYIRETLIDALGDEKAKDLLDKTALIEKKHGLDALTWHDPKQLTDFFKAEHPQVIAVLITYLDSHQAASLLSLLDESVRVDVLKRVAVLGSIHPAALEMLNEAIEDQLHDGGQFEQLPLGGARAAASIINYLDSDTETKVIDALRLQDAELVEHVQSMMFGFENLLDLDGGSLQRILRKVPVEVLIDALRISDEALKVRCIAHLLEPQAGLLKSKLENPSAVQLSKVMAAQKQVVAVVQQLAKSGEIVWHK